MFLAADKERLKQLVLRRISKEGIVDLLKKKRQLEKVCQVKRSMEVYTNGPHMSTDSLMSHLHSESSNEGLAGLTEDYIHEKLYIELGKIVLNAVQADRVSLYLTSPGETGLNRRAYTWSANLEAPTQSNSQLISSVAKHVTRTHVGMLVEDLTQDRRFNNYCSLEDEISVICIPIIDMNKDIVGVIELTRGMERPPFTEKNYQVADGYIVWACLGIQQVLINESYKRKKNLCRFLVGVTNDMFHDITEYHQVIQRIMDHTKTLVTVERCLMALFSKVTNELYVEVIDTGKEKYEVPRKPYRFPVDQNTISGHVATTRKSSIHNTINERNRQYYAYIEDICKVKVVNIISIPIMNGACFLGVFHAINKRDGAPFQNVDIDVLKTFSVYFALAVNYSKIYADMEATENCALVAIEQLEARALKQKSDVVNNLELNMTKQEELPFNFNSHLFVITDDVRPELPRLYVAMIYELFGGWFDNRKLCSFTETVCRNYRDIPYHNWEHAFMVAHCMYLMLKDPVLSESLSAFEGISLLIACICHDLDHRGYNNTFFEILDLPLAALYSTSVMEQHHFQMTVLILQQEHNAIFENLSGDEYKEMLERLRHAIIATDLAVYFGTNKPLLEALTKTNTFDIKDTTHKNIMLAAAMTACDLCGAAKPWVYQVRNVKLIYDEFFIQGDIERERGFEPIAMMNRENKEKVVDQQSGFMKYVALPLYSTLGTIIPAFREMAETVEDNSENWFRIAAGENIPPWDPSLPDTIGMDREWSTLSRLESMHSIMSCYE